MDHSLRLQFLKLHLGTLFLKSYSLPKLNDVVRVIGDDVKLLQHNNQFDTVVCALKELLQRVLERRGDLIIFSTNGFLNLFEDRLPTFDPSVVPIDKVNSGLTFFEKFTDPSFTCATNSDIEMLVEWCLLAVQFLDADKERMEMVLKLFEDLLTFYSPENNVRGYDEVDLVNNGIHDDDEGIDLTCDVDYNTKHCWCYEYEKSGDCYCLNDV